MGPSPVPVLFTMIAHRCADEWGFLVISGGSSSSRARELWTARPLFVSTGGRAPLSGFTYRALGSDPAPALQSGRGIPAGRGLPRYSDQTPPPPRIGAV